MGVATAKALGQALGLGVVGVTSLDVLAAGAREAAGHDRADRVVAVVDARRGEVFAAAYDFTRGTAGADPDPAAVRHDRPEALTPEDLAAWLDGLASAGPLLVVGDGAVRHLERPRPPGRPRPGPGRDGGRAVARRCWPAWPPGAWPPGRNRWPAGDVVPDYRRHADAKINWEERAPQRTAAPPAPRRP